MYNTYNIINNTVAHNNITWSCDNPVYGNTAIDNIPNINSPINNNIIL